MDNRIKNGNGRKENINNPRKTIRRYGGSEYHYYGIIQTRISGTAVFTRGDQGSKSSTKWVIE